MEKLGIGYAVPEDYSKFFNSETGKFELRNIIKLDTSKLKHRKGWCAPNKVAPERIPSSLIMDPEIISSGLAILSVVIDEDDLYDPSTGIFENHEEKGRQWERSCFISYFEDGKLLFGSGAGIRVHGAKKERGFRLYFRDIYGFDQFKPGILFDRESEPLRHIVVHDDSRGGFHYINPLAYDIAQRIGCIVPQTKPVRVYLDGAVHGRRMYSLTEHLSKEYLVSHYGHDNYVFVRSRGRKTRPVEYKKLKSWARNKDVKMTMEEVGKYVDIENLSRWWISQLFCATTDIYQGLALLDKSRLDSKWFWINWDMDHSFRNKYEPEIKNIWEQKKAFDDVMNKKKGKSPRAILFKRLHNDDPEFQKYFERLFMNALNHRLTSDFLESRVNYYEKIAISFGVKDLDYVNQSRLFFKHRHSFMRKLMRKYFGSPESCFCQVKGPNDIIYEIDGFVSGSGYGGWYFKDSQITVKIDGKNGKAVSYWLINGKKIKSCDNKLTYRVNSETTIEPIFTHQ